jgi:hypothetical protein
MGPKQCSTSSGSASPPRKKKVKSELQNLKRFEIQIERYYNLKESRLTAEEKDSNKVRERGVDRLKHLFEGVALVVAAYEATCNEVG